MARRRAIKDTTLTVGIKQGTGAVTNAPFGSSGSHRPRGGQRSARRGSRKGRGGGGRRRGLNLSCWNAFAEPHLPLPRAVAPYTIIRTTAIWNPSSDHQRRLALFGPIMDVGSDAGQWSNYYSISANVTLSSLRNSANGAYLSSFGSMSSSSWGAASVTPAAFSVQILNKEALQTSTGMVYIGRCKNKVHLAEGDNSTSWQDLADNLVSYSNPRMCSAGKLALRGVHVDAVPNNMSELAKFTTLHQSGDAPITIDATDLTHHEGFNPIFIYNPDAVALQVLVCCEWRVRFDPSNPAYAACRMHKPSTDTSWAEHLQQAVALGNGVADIVEVVARAGNALRAVW
ncbi:hypothetical protein 2 [Beihai sobemo-like virus 4]|uniref:hypothetical protein 2 n=1 Tax=Beihai sobemo-like virus 4 TaxID=1922701 RepID=UPI00090A60B2|nr:hypothetical protein 2 [Beihai sobemo-like virus 4]APG75696.1 hypothetical protein 2 [Beihai sobemo-like virus 4]